MTLARALTSSVAMDWRTPAVVLDLVRQLGPIGFDPCPGEGDLVGAEDSSDGTNGLEMDWRGRGLIYVNCPYGRALPDWAEKIHRTAERNAEQDVEIVALVPARTDTAWWHDHIRRADSICFWRGRLTFVGAPGPAPFPSAVAYFGPRPSSFRSVFKGVGWVVRR